MKNQEYLKNFANKVKCMRERQGISQEKLAEKAGLHRTYNRTYIGMVERVERNPSLISIYKIAEGLGTDVKELL